MRWIVVLHSKPKLEYTYLDLVGSVLILLLLMLPLNFFILKCWSNWFFVFSTVSLLSFLRYKCWY